MGSAKQNRKRMWAWEQPGRYSEPPLSRHRDTTRISSGHQSGVGLHWTSTLSMPATPTRVPESIRTNPGSLSSSIGSYSHPTPRDGRDDIQRDRRKPGEAPSEPDLSLGGEGEPPLLRKRGSFAGGSLGGHIAPATRA